MKKLTCIAALTLCLLLTACSSAKKVESYYIATGTNQCYAAVDDSLFSATSTGVTVYDANGEAVIQQSLELKYPAVCENAGNAAVYGIGGTQVVFLDGSGIEAKNNIICADLSDSGHLALCTEEAGYKGSVTLYSADKTEVYKWYSADSRIVKASVSPGGEYLAVLVSGEKGSIVKLFALNSPDELGTFSAENTVFNDIGWLGGRICCVGTDKLCFIDENGRAKGEYSFDGKYLGDYAFCGEEIVLELRAHSFGGAGTLVAVDNAAGQCGTAQPEAEIECFDYSDGKLLALTQDKLLCFKRGLKLCFETEQSGAQRAFLGTNDAMLISGAEVKISRLK